MIMATSKKPAHTVNKITTAANKAAHTASHNANKATNVALSAVESTRNSAENVVKIGTDTMKEFFANGAGEAQKAHEKVFAIGRESAQNASRAVDALTRTLNDLVALGRDNAEAATEVGHVTADIARSINNEIVNFANNNFADNVEMCKEAFSCRNINDIFDIQSKWLSTNLENFFAQSTRLTEMCFHFANEAAEPINERVAEATERFSKSLAA
jgi:phasin family protein